MVSSYFLSRKNAEFTSTNCYSQRLKGQKHRQENEDFLFMPVGFPTLPLIFFFFLYHHFLLCFTCFQKIRFLVKSREIEFLVTGINCKRDMFRTRLNKPGLEMLLCGSITHISLFIHGSIGFQQHPPAEYCTRYFALRNRLVLGVPYIWEW